MSRFFAIFGLVLVIATSVGGCANSMDLNPQRSAGERELIQGPLAGITGGWVGEQGFDHVSIEFSPRLFIRERSIRIENEDSPVQCRVRETMTKFKIQKNKPTESFDYLIEGTPSVELIPSEGNDPSCAEYLKNEDSRSKDKRRLSFQFSIESDRRLSSEWGGFLKSGL